MAKSTKRFRIVVAGGAGAMGQITVRDLVDFFPAADIVIADYDKAKADLLAKSLKRPQSKFSMTNNAVNRRSKNLRHMTVQQQKALAVLQLEIINSSTSWKDIQQPHFQLRNFPSIFKRRLGIDLH